MEIFIFVLEIIGTIAFAISGAITGIKKNMDVFGVIILAVTTSVGGGIIRDLILGINPPGAFRHPIYSLIAVIVGVLQFTVAKLLGRKYAKDPNKAPDFRSYEIALLIMDAFGLGIFTVVGIQTAFQTSTKYNVVLLVFVGVITGVGGGVLRDVMAGERPYIFVKHIYACASIAGAILCVLLWRINSTAAILAGASLVILIRGLAAIFHWSLPKADVYIEENKD